MDTPYRRPPRSPGLHSGEPSLIKGGEMELEQVPFLLREAMWTVVEQNLR